jgi:SAM-dependent methyltransferase
MTSQRLAGLRAQWALALRSRAIRRRRLAAMAASEPQPTSHRNDVPESVWFWDHYDNAANEVIDFLAGDGITLEGSEVADVGCGDGIIDLGLVHKGKPALLHGFDVNLTDTGHLLRRASEEGVCNELPSNLEFKQSEPRRLPTGDNAFDFVVTWSAFEHIADPVSVLTEIRRILRPTGMLFLQLWPFYYSSAGSHLWDWFDSPYPHLLLDDEEVTRDLRADPKPSVEWTEYMLDEYLHLNRITLDELQRSILAAGLAVRKFELMTQTVHVPPQLQRYTLSQLGIFGVKLIATPT